MRLEIQAIGNPNFPRYVIAKETGGVFDGTGWSKDRKNAVMYVQGQDIAVQFRNLEETMNDHLPLRAFTVTMNIKVRSAEHFAQKELEVFLQSAVAILLDHAKGTGPTPNSLVQLDVTWSEMKEQVVTKDKNRR